MRSILFLTLISFLLSTVLGEIRDPTTVVGNKRPADVTEEGVIAAAEAAVRYIEQLSNTPYTHKLLSIESATKQVVSGIKYQLILHSAPTNCLKTNVDAHIPSVCTVDNDKITRHTVTVLSQPWRTPAFQVEITASERIEH